VAQIWRLGGGEKFVSERTKELVFNAFSYLEPVKRTEDWSDVAEFGSFDDGTCKRVLDFLDPSA